ncbi:hypothetical protein UFOVP653_74 [uncultured Caudovirales phage]|uniref:Uncharacterized protein n=1 Tax=uncultured Caudovirales phage TaxID=2100421 RepID=A0A6J5N8N8_9CAUD|nr:hypothetical protein UFOVP653_74 [uncultured Caudovirales phage]
MIRKYYCVKDGYLTRRGECEEQFIQAEDGEAICFGDPPDDLHPAPPQRSAQQLRRDAYPAVGAQLDWLWHAMNDGTLPRVEPFYSEIKAVKERYPKPSN